MSFLEGGLCYMNTKVLISHGVFGFFLSKILIRLNVRIFWRFLILNFKCSYFAFIFHETFLPANGENYVNSFVPNAPFFYPLIISENLTVFWCFQGVEKGCIVNKCVIIYLQFYHAVQELGDSLHLRRNFFWCLIMA